MNQLDLYKINWVDLTIPERRLKITEFEKACVREAKTKGVSIEPEHTICNGVYTRRIVIPKGTALVGEIHAQECINIVSEGSIVVVTDDGIRKIDAPITFISKAGTKRLGYTLEKTIWTTVHRTDFKDLENIRNELIVPSYDALENIKETK